MKMRDGRSMERGDQIVYVPEHARNGGFSHPDIEFGFITSLKPDGSAAFCRYWSKENPKELRTTSCSELTYIRNIYLWLSKPQCEVNEALAMIEEKE